MHRTFITITLLLIGLTSCTKERVLKKYYILNDDSSQESVTADHKPVQPFPLGVQVNAFTISDAYNHNRIALRTKSNEIQFYYFHHWAENPAAAIRYLVWKKLSDARLFRNCAMQISDQIPDYLVKGRIDHIERSELNQQTTAYLKMTLVLVSVSDDRIILTQNIDRHEVIKESGGINTFAAQISSILHQEIDLFIDQSIAALQ